jgi:hypothetical protein
MTVPATVGLGVVSCGVSEALGEGDGDSVTSMPPPSGRFPVESPPEPSGKARSITTTPATTSATTIAKRRVLAATEK